MADVYLIRRTNGIFAKYEGATAVSLTGQITGVSGVTGVAATDIVTFPAGVTIVNGYSFEFNSLTGGTNLSTGVKYFLIGVSGQTAQLALSVGGTAVDFSTNLTASSGVLQTDELYVWSSEFRDIFSAGTVSQLVETIPIAGAASAITLSNAVIGAGPAMEADLTASTSDEIAHKSLRQTFLARTHWKFTMSAGPSPLYATWADGDIIANNPPNT